MDRKNGISTKSLRKHNNKSLKNLYFTPPEFGVTALGNSHGFDSEDSTSGFIIWINGKGIMVDPTPYASHALNSQGIPPNRI